MIPKFIKLTLIDYDEKKVKIKAESPIYFINADKITSVGVNIPSGFSMVYDVTGKFAIVKESVPEILKLLGRDD